MFLSVSFFIYSKSEGCIWDDLTKQMLCGIPQKNLFRGFWNTLKRWGREVPILVQCCSTEVSVMMQLYILYLLCQHSSHQQYMVARSQWKVASGTEEVN